MIELEIKCLYCETRLENITLDSREVEKLDSLSGHIKLTPPNPITNHHKDKRIGEISKHIDYQVILPSGNVRFAICHGSYAVIRGLPREKDEEYDSFYINHTRANGD